MAAGDTLFVLRPSQSHFSGTNLAEFNLRNRRPMIAFSGTTTEKCYFFGTIPRHFDAGGITLKLLWTTASATSGTCRWRARFDRYDTGVAIDAESYGTQIEATGTAPASAGNAVYTDLAFSSSEIDSLAAGESFKIEVDRQHDDGADTITSDVQLYMIEGREV